MALNPPNSSNLEQLALKGLKQHLTSASCFRVLQHVDDAGIWRISRYLSRIRDCHVVFAKHLHNCAHTITMVTVLSDDLTNRKTTLNYTSTLE